MKVKIRKAIYFSIISVLVLLIGIHAIDRWMEFSDEDIGDYFQQHNIEVAVFHQQSKNETVRVVKSGKSSNTSIVCIHGAPGGWDAYKSFMIDSALMANAEIISYDRPGYGPFSDDPVISFKEQAVVLKEIIDKYANSDHIILLSHSYGGPIAAQYMANTLDKYVSHLMVAPAIDPESEKYFWVSPLGYWKATKWLMPNNYITASYEKYTHVSELRKLEKRLVNLGHKTIHMHGTEDWLAPHEGNVKFVKDHFPDSLTEQIILSGAGHLLIWEEEQIIKEKILEIIQ